MTWKSFLWTVVAAGLLVARPASAADGAQQVVVPTTERGDVSETFFGETIADPYRWLEADVRESTDVADWVAAQAAATERYLDALPMRADIAARMTALWNTERFGVPVRRKDRYFFRRNSGLQNQDVLYVQQGLNGTPRVLIDPNSWSADGATALAEAEPSPDGRRVLYAVQDGGSDWRTLKVLDINTGRVLDDQIDWVKFSPLVWARDSSGFYYARYPAPQDGEAFQELNYNQALYFHKLGTPQSADRLVYARPDNPDHGFGADISDDGRTLVITVWKGTDDAYEVLVADLQDTEADPRLIVAGFRHDYSFIGAKGTQLFFRTNADAPRGRIVLLDLANAPPEAGPDALEWTEVVGEAEATLEGASLLGARLLATYLVDARNEVRRFRLDGRPDGIIELPGLGSVAGLEGDSQGIETFYAFTSFAAPPTIFRYVSTTGESSLFKAPELAFNPDDYVVRQVFYPSKDGTRIPMFISHRKDLDLTQPQPTLLYGYGGFNIALTPSFSVTRLTWMDMGGIYAVANLRGGGEYGKAWHDAGRRANKQNVFDDFIAAGEHLVREEITTPGQLAIMGGSNGGLLVGAVTNQRPDLFVAAVPIVGVMDMLRFNQFTAGRFWVDDYGDPAVEADFRVLRAYSPYHNIRGGADYPAVLVVTADTDDRVVPGHSFKYVARLQASATGDAPKLIRIETRAGHGAGKPTDKTIAEYSDIWAFVARHTRLAASRMAQGEER